jgi:hypothetical protein
LNETFFDRIHAACPNNIIPSGSNNPLSHQYEYDIVDQSASPVNVTLNILEIQVEAY